MVGRVLFYYAVEEKWKTNYYLLTLHMAFGEFYYFLGDSPGHLVKYWFNHKTPLWSYGLFFFLDGPFCTVYLLLVIWKTETCNFIMHCTFICTFTNFQFSLHILLTLFLVCMLFCIALYFYNLHPYVSSIWGKDISLGTIEVLSDLENCCQWWWAITVLFYIKPNEL